MICLFGLDSIAFPSFSFLFHQFFQHISGTVNLCLYGFQIDAGFSRNLSRFLFPVKVLQRDFLIRTFQLFAQLADMPNGFPLQTGFFRTGTGILQLFKLRILFRKCLSFAAFQIIQCFVAGNPAKPGFFIGSVETGEIAVGSQKCFLGQIFCIKTVSGNPVTDAVDQFFILFYQIRKVLFITDWIRLPSCFYTV